MPRTMSDPRTESRFRAGLRWTIALILILYGFAKLNGSQFTVLDSELDRPMGEVSGFWLTWYYFGYSAVYGSLIAVAQIAGALLLTSRRWWLAGGLLLLPIVGNIVLVDLFYGVDAGATVMAVLLLAGLIYLLAPRARRLIDQVRMDVPRSRAVAPWAARAAILLAAFGATWWIANVNNRRPTAIDGVWDAVVAEGEAHGVDRVFFERNRAHMAVFRDASGDHATRHFEVGESGTVRIWSEWLRKGDLLYEGAVEPDGTLRLAAATSATGARGDLILHRRTGDDLHRRTGGDPMLEPRTTAMNQATGTFDVTLTPRSEDEEAGGTTLGRASIEKRFHGDLEGTAVGEMLTAIAAVDGSAGYVAIERVTGTLHGRRGSFVFQHSGTMARGTQELVLAVIPDSGTGELEGLSGTMQIRIEGGRHFYQFDYALGSTAP